MSQHCAFTMQGTQSRPCTRWNCKSDKCAPPAGPSGQHLPQAARQVSRHQQISRIRAQAYREPHEQLQWPAQLAGAAAAALMAFSGPASAEIQTVAPSEAAQRAQPIPQQTVNKRTVWVLFGGGAAAIFGSALLLEKNQRFFPAIYKANETMRRAKEADQARALTEKAVLDLEQQDDMRLQRSVEAGLANAQARNLPEASSSDSKHQDAPQPDTQQPATSSSAPPSAATSQSTAEENKAVNADQHQEQAGEYGKGSTMSDEDKQKAAVSSVK